MTVRDSSLFGDMGFQLQDAHVSETQVNSIRPDAVAILLTNGEARTRDSGRSNTLKGNVLRQAKPPLRQAKPPLKAMLGRIRWLEPEWLEDLVHESKRPAGPATGVHA